MDIAFPDKPGPADNGLSRGVPALIIGIKCATLRFFTVGGPDTEHVIDLLDRRQAAAVSRGNQDELSFAILAYFDPFGQHRVAVPRLQQGMRYQVDLVDRMGPPGIDEILPPALQNPFAGEQVVQLCCRNPGAGGQHQVLKAVVIVGVQVIAHLFTLGVSPGAKAYLVPLVAAVPGIAGHLAQDGQLLPAFGGGIDMSV